PDVLGLIVGGVVGPSTEPQPYSASSDETAIVTVVFLKSVCMLASTLEVCPSLLCKFRATTAFAKRCRALLQESGRSARFKRSNGAFARRARSVRGRGGCDVPVSRRNARRDVT
ncbi:highly repetitive protein, partial [Burkholderia cepacia]